MKLFGHECNTVIKQIFEEMSLITCERYSTGVRISRQGISSTTNQPAAVRTHRNPTRATTWVHSQWKNAICYIRVQEHIHAGNVKVVLRLLRAERDGLFELHLIVVCEIRSLVSSCRQRQLCEMFACMNGMAALQQKQPRFYECLVFDRYDSEISIKQLEQDRRTQIERQLLHNPNYRKIILKTPKTHQHRQSSHVCTWQRRHHRSSSNTNGLCWQEVSTKARL